MEGLPADQGFDARPTIGALYAGSLASVALSAVLAIQTLLYFMFFSADNIRFKGIVGWVWASDTAHTISVAVAIWQYGVLNFSQPQYLLDIAPALSATVALTGITTLNSNVFYGWRIHRMSKGNLKLTIPIGLLAVTRIVMVIFLSVEMILCETWALISLRFKPMLVAALGISAATDIMLAATRYFFLRELKQGYMGVPEMVDAVVIFTINDGLLTCTIVVAAIICFALMPQNYIWVGIYLTLSKLYSNSILVTLNLRNWYRHKNRPYLGPQIDYDARMRRRTGAQTPTEDYHGKGTGSFIGGRAESSRADDDDVESVEVHVNQRVDYTVRVLPVGYEFEGMGRPGGRSGVRADYPPRPSR
ncbi:hypothetical protein HMN09_01396500 [Mycena chlorophos]|uniref:DUF6534 domain-containing protein n=1 Tax=Mycena chlorophos TaxID=658473 RepID=A0A8H6VSI4_MYCCL|nr:hypothetical protein HMN09_01396500 [Mycena chlorophos]